jgi:hypothetical protein
MAHAMMYGDLSVIKCFASGGKNKATRKQSNDDTYSQFQLIYEIFQIFFFPIFTHRAVVILYTILKQIKINEWFAVWFSLKGKRMVDNHK